jgi:aspartate oxidase
VLASGGIRGLYAQSDNPNDITGEGIGMAWRHGAEIIDMEIIQFYPYRLVYPQNVDVFTKVFGHGAKMINEDGKRFMERFPKKELETRDIVCYEMHKQKKVILDLSEVDKEGLKKISRNLYQILKKGFDGELLMSPVEHYSMGGIKVDENGRTNIKGLFACGKCTGGLHGANRLGSGSLTEAIVFGNRTGIAAATESISKKVRKGDWGKTRG